TRHQPNLRGDEHVSPDSLSDELPRHAFEPRRRGSGQAYRIWRRTAPSGFVPGAKAPLARVADTPDRAPVGNSLPPHLQSGIEEASFGLGHRGRFGTVAHLSFGERHLSGSRGERRYRQADIK